MIVAICEPDTRIELAFSQYRLFKSANPANSLVLKQYCEHPSMLLLITTSDIYNGHFWLIVGSARIELTLSVATREIIQL